jgi:phosphoribosylaminoimidazole-succinocarboxamide synthase
MVLVDFKIEFGVDSNGVIMLGDEISPDSCRLWDSVTLESLDKDLFRNSTGNVMDVYNKVLEKIVE